MTRKRFTDADKWEDGWFFSLTPFSKLVWFYILDRCDHAGFWKVNRPMAETCLGTRLDWPSIEKDLEGRIESQSSGTIWFIPKFLKFQYPKGLDDNCKPHRGVISVLRDRNSLVRVTELFGKGYVRVQDKEQDKEESSSNSSSNADDIGSPSQAVAGPVADSDHWRMQLQHEPWVRSLKDSLCKIGPGTWRQWSAIIAEHGLPVTIATAKGIPAGDRWPDAVSDALTASRGQANPGDVVASKIQRITL